MKVYEGVKMLITCFYRGVIYKYDHRYDTLTLSALSKHLNQTGIYTYTL